jgi:hypothetical protein
MKMMRPNVDHVDDADDHKDGEHGGDHGERDDGATPYDCQLFLSEPWFVFHL